MDLIYYFSTFGNRPVLEQIAIIICSLSLLYFSVKIVDIMVSCYRELENILNLRIIQKKTEDKNECMFINEFFKKLEKVRER